MYNLCMIDKPSTLLVRTYQVAIGLKFIGALVAIGVSYGLVREWVFDGWAMALTTPLILLLLTLPRQNRNRWLVAALAFGIIAPHIDLFYAIWFPRESLLTNPRYIAIGWSLTDVNRIHAMGQFFIIVPVILASWQFGIRGFVLALGLAGTLYIAMPFLLRPDSLIWGIYAVRGFVFLGVTLIAGFIVGTLAAAQRRTNAALSDANAQLAQQAVTMAQLATSQERNRLARELHDTLAHSLSGTAVSLQAVSTLLKHNPDAAKTELATAQAQIRSGLTESRRAIAALRASPLEELGLLGAIEQRASDIAARAEVEIVCNLAPLSPLAPEVEQTLFRICDEALINAEKHAQATQISVNLSEMDEQIALTVADNGVGFVVDGVENGRFGLIGMKERAALIGASLVVESAVGEGTVVECVVDGKQ